LPFGAGAPRGREHARNKILANAGRGTRKSAPAWGKHPPRLGGAGFGRGLATRRFPRAAAAPRERDPCAASTRLPRQEGRDRAGRRSGGKARPIGPPGRFFDAQEEAATIIDGTVCRRRPARAARHPGFGRSRSRSRSQLRPTPLGRVESVADGGAGPALGPATRARGGGRRRVFVANRRPPIGRRFSLSRIVKGGGTISSD
jgi:hypothetical protein